MQAAAPSPHSAAAGLSSAPSSSGTRPLPSLDSSRSSADQPLQFLANHHRAHNPNDPKLRSNPSFKSRRSSLFGSVLKSKSKDSTRKPASTLPYAVSPTLTKTRSTGAPTHQHTQSLPTSNRDIISRQGLSANVGEFGSSTPTTALHQRHKSRVSQCDPQPQPPISVTNAAKSDLLHLADAPQSASLSSPVELAEGSASTCSFTHDRSLSLASIPSPGTSPSVDAAFAPMSAPSEQADFAGLPSTSISANTVTGASDSPRRPESPGNSHGPIQLHGPSPSRTSSPDRHPASSSRPPASEPRGSPLSTLASQTPTPLITRTPVSDNSIRSTIQSNDVLLDSPARGSTDVAPQGNAAATVSEHREAAAQRLTQSTSTSVTSPQRFSSLSRKSAARLTVNRDGPESLTLPRISARDITEELDSPTSALRMSPRADRRMSMLDFLTADHLGDPSTQLAQASHSAEDLPRTLHTPDASSGGSAKVPPHIPLVHASRQLKLDMAAAHSKVPQTRRIDLCERVRVGVEPLTDRLTMFGSMQSSSNYSLAGSVVIEVPKFTVPRLSSLAAVARDGMTTDNPSVHVESLTVRFTGYSVYVDATGRFNAIKLAEVAQELLQPQGFACPVEIVATGEQLTSPEGTSAEQEMLKYETEFDLSIPGWLPASQRSRFGATFYCVQATAIVEGHAILSALSGFDGMVGSDQSPGLNSATSLESELRQGPDARSPVERKGSAQSSPASARGKTKNTWLNKTAKQLQLRTSKKSPIADLGPSGSKDAIKAPGQEDPLFTKTSEAINQLLPNGQHSIKGECLSILVRRCRDIVPVPVARLARLATASQVMRAEGRASSLSRSMMELARLQEADDSAVTSTAVPTSDSAAPVRPHLPASVSAPMSLAANTEQASSQPDGDSLAPVDAANLGAITNSSDAAANVAHAQSTQTLAPSPRIDSASREWNAEPRPNPSEDRELIAMTSRVPSAFDAPRDPAKLAAASLTPSATMPNLPSSMSRASSLLDPRFGNAQSPPRSSSRPAPISRSAAPLRHFVHRPTINLPPGLGVPPDDDANGGLNFSLTLSLPSHVHVAGPKSDVLSFGVSIEVGRTKGWEALRNWGGLRLKDMELVCLQTERHSSMPSRSFQSAFPVPPQPNKVDACDMPVVTSWRKTLSATDEGLMAMEMRLRRSYDRSLVLNHISLANQGKAPHPVEHNVERIRTTIVGPPPFALPKREQGSGKKDGEASEKGKARVDFNNGDAADAPGGSSRSPQRGSPAGSGTNTPDGTSQSAGLGSSLRAAFAPTAVVNPGQRWSAMQPTSRVLARSNNSSSSSLRQAFGGSDGSSAMQPAPRSAAAGSATVGATAGSRRPIPFDRGATNLIASSSAGNGADKVDADEQEGMGIAVATQSSQAGARGSAAAVDRSTSNGDASVAAREAQPPAPANTAPRMGVTSTVSTRSGAAAGTQSPPRRSRFETAISRLSTFATSMLEQPTEAVLAASNPDLRASGSARSSANGAQAASLRATYAFSGDDGQGVDLTKGRVRMTINLPLVSNDAEAARKAGSAQLIPDFESPYVRIRHKLKVKLGFGLNGNVTTAKNGEEWAQALVMCLPVRFTEAPPREVQEQFGPVDIVPANPRSTDPGASLPNRGRQSTAAGTSEPGSEAVNGSSEAPASSDSGLPQPFAEPLLPAYAQLFREDGSRLADEGEDLPRYPGRMSVVGEIDEDPADDTVRAEDHEEEVVQGDTTLQTPNTLSRVDEDPVAPGVSELEGGPVGDSPSYFAMPGSSSGVIDSLLRPSNLGIVPTPMDRTTSLPGPRILTRTTSSSIYGLRPPPLHSTLPGSSIRSTSASYADRSYNAGTKQRVGSSAFDPLPTRPGMRPRSATTASLVTFSRITPAEVLDESLVTNALDDEEDRLDTLPPSHTLESLGGLSQRDGQEDEDEDEEGDSDLNLSGADSPEEDSEAGHNTVGTHGHTRMLEGSDSEAEEEVDEVVVGRAL